MIERH